MGGDNGVCGHMELSCIVLSFTYSEYTLHAETRAFLRVVRVR